MSKFVVIFYAVSVRERTVNSFTRIQSFQKRRWYKIGTLCLGRAEKATRSSNTTLIPPNPLLSEKVFLLIILMIQIVGVLRDRNMQRMKLWWNQKGALLKTERRVTDSRQMRKDPFASEVQTLGVTTI